MRRYGLPRARARRGSSTRSYALFSANLPVADELLPRTIEFCREWCSGIRTAGLLFVRAAVAASCTSSEKRRAAS